MDIINLQYTTIQMPLPDSVWKKLRIYSSGANVYRPQPTELIEKLTQIHNIPKEMFYLTAGNDEAIQMFALAYGKHAYAFIPTYIVYADVEEFGGKLTRIDSIVDNTYQIMKLHGLKPVVSKLMQAKLDHSLAFLDTEYNLESSFRHSLLC